MRSEMYRSRYGIESFRDSIDELCAFRFFWVFDNFRTSQRFHKKKMDFKHSYNHEKYTKSSKPWKQTKKTKTLRLDMFTTNRKSFNFHVFPVTNALFSTKFSREDVIKDVFWKHEMLIEPIIGQ